MAVDREKDSSDAGFEDVGASALRQDADAATRTRGLYVDTTPQRGMSRPGQENISEREARKIAEGMAKAEYIDLRYGDYNASICTFGAALRLLEYRGKSLVESFPVGQPPLLQCGVILAPWPNRIADGKFNFQGEDYQLEINEPERNNALHGLVHNKNWRVVASDSHAAVLTTNVPPTEHWPWPLELAVTFNLDSDGMHITMRATSDAECAPFACGWHTYLNPQDGDLGAAMLQINVSKQLPLDRVRKLPSGPVAESELAEQLQKGLELKDLLLDDCFQAPEVPLKVKMTSGGKGVRLTSSPEMSWVQVFTADKRWDCPFPDGRRAIAVEPMSAPPNSLRSGEDVTELSRRRVANFGIRLQAC